MSEVDEGEDRPGPSLGARVFVIVVGTLLAVGAAELALRVVTSRTQYRVLPANARAEFSPAPGVMPGVSGTSVYTTSADGVRGRAYPRSDARRLLTIGGSTTECLYLDDSEAWPALLETRLSKALGGPVWVGNVGVSGHGMAEHVQIARYLVPQLAPDYTLALVGANDLVPVLRLGDQYDPAREDPDDLVRFLDNTFRSRPLYDPRWPARFPAKLASWNLFQRGVWIVKRYMRSELADGGVLVEDAAGTTYARRREQLRGVPLLDELPDLEPALARFERSLHQMVDAVHAAGSRLVLLTQPSVWNAGLSAEHEKLLWIAFLGRKDAPVGRYAPAQLERALARFNRTTLRVCEETAAQCIDVATALESGPRESYYYDDAHFTELGARALADAIAAWFAQHVPAPQ